jgi:hypothetical protein
MNIASGKLKVSACTLRWYFFGVFANKDRIIMLLLVLSLSKESVKLVPKESAANKKPFSPASTG